MNLFDACYALLAHNGLTIDVGSGAIVNGTLLTGTDSAVNNEGEIDVGVGNTAIDVLGGTGKTGGLDISIRGMPSEYTLILIDGRRQNTAGSVTPNGFGETSTSFMPPMSAIERIEVIRGPMSTLYGSDAMGGVINIITRKDYSGGEVTLNYTNTFDTDTARRRGCICTISR